jgi:hypothetical protein
MKETLEKVRETGKEFGFQTIAIKKVTTMKANIKMIKKVDLVYTGGRMAQHTKESF